MIFAKISQYWAKYKVALVIFLSSRFLLFSAMVLAIRYNISNNFGWQNWDSKHYISIASSGYTFGGTHGVGNTIAFFPLYPLLVKCLHFVSGFSYELSGVLLNLVLGSLAAVALYRYVMRWRDEPTARVAVYLMSYYPLSVFMTTPYAESLLLLLIVSTFNFLEEEKYEKAAFTISLACVTKIMSLMLIPIFVVQVVKRKQNQLLPKSLLTMAVPFSMFMIFQFVKFGTPFAFLKAQQIGWHKSLDWPWNGLRYLYNRGFERGWIQWQVESLFLVMAGVILYKARRILPWQITAFSCALLMICVCTNIPFSIGRFLICFLPIYLYGSVKLVNRPVLQQVLITGLGVWMTIFGIAFTMYRRVF